MAKVERILLGGAGIFLTARALYLSSKAQEREHSAEMMLDVLAENMADEDELRTLIRREREKIRKQQAVLGCPPEDKSNSCYFPFDE